MKPIDPSDSHLEDRAIEFRVLKSLVVVFLVTLASVFFRWEFVFGAFAVGYVAYRARYYGRRVGVYSTDDLDIWADRLEYGLLGFVAVTVGVAVAVEAVFPPDWILGGFLSLPPIDFTDIQGLLQEPLIPVGWAVVVAPVVGASYVALQFRKRLLVGLDSRRGAVRATIWDSLVYLPVSFLWIAVLTMGPVYDVWEPVVDAVSTELELTPGTTGGFGVIFGERFAPVVSAGIGVPAAVVGAYLGVQRRKYEDATMPEILGYRGFMPPSRDFHQLNAVAPAGTYALYAVAIFVTLGTLPVAEPALLLGVAVAAVVGANVLGKTTTTLQSLSEELGESVDAVVVGFALGLVLVAVALPVVGAKAQSGEVLLAYPVLGVPLTYAGNWLAGRQAVSSTSEYADSVEADWNAFDESMTDRLFVYSDTRDNTLRAAAIDGLASSVRANTYRKGEALDVFGRALASDDEEIVRAGLRGIAGVLAYDRSKETYERLAHAGAPGWITWYLDSSSERTRILAAEAGARIFAVALDVGESTPAEQLDEDDVEGIGDVVEHNPNEPALVAAVVEYFSRLWFVAARQDDGIGPNHPDVQRVLGTLIWLSEYADENTRLAAAFAVTGERAVADEERLTLALDRLDSESTVTPTGSTPTRLRRFWKIARMPSGGWARRRSWRSSGSPRSAATSCATASCSTSKRTRRHPDEPRAPSSGRCRP
ncbi:hypothetical protein BRC65_04015 [Halobacteriales archaeon QH_2_65_14]|nr:MAG: hypothetical protein BRC65_04015 [Halobacteriales archaeon QH_2_65_14]